ncbi:acetylcholine receptor subunit alpha-like [Convolutriloba macropyga]|uniref:acetylcholine receptor subunit alpha-like n=1 Tax=Convolutriloba macropyga TaxID=536237 RepID=UPI003F528A82
MSRLLPTTLPLILFILAPADTFYTREEEQEWVASILNQTTNHTPHSNMLNNTVFICLDLYQLLGIDEKEGTVNIKLWLYITYYLPHIVWDPATNGQYFMPPNTVWAPDIVSYDATEVVFDVFNRQLISFDGIVVASSTTVNVKVTCSISVRHFPFDTQECKFSMGQWVRTQSSYRVSTDPTFTHPTQLDLISFRQSGHWLLIKPVNYFKTYRTFKNLTYYTYDEIEYVLNFKRHPTFYVTVIVIPSLLMGFMSILSLILPVECGEKVSLGVTILLAQVVELLVLSDILPPGTSDDFPIIGYFVIFLIILVSISVIVCVGVTAVYYTPHCKNVPKWMVRLISSRLMSILFIAKLNLSACANQSEDFKEDHKEIKANGHANKSNQVSANKSNQVSDTNMFSLDRLMRHQKFRFAINEVGWKMFAALIDRSFFICYALVLIGGTLYFYLSAIDA